MKASRLNLLFDAESAIQKAIVVYNVKQYFSIFKAVCAFEVFVLIMKDRISGLNSRV